MQKNYKITIGSLVAVVILLAIIIWALSPNRYDWAEKFRKDEAQPYDTQVLYKLLKSYLPDNNFTEIERSFEEELPISEEASSYVFVGKKIHLVPDEADYLFNYVEQGNDVFMAARTFPSYFINKLYPEQEEYEDFYENETGDLSTEEVEEEYYDEDYDEDFYDEEENWEEESWTESDSTFAAEMKESEELEERNWGLINIKNDSVASFNYVHEKLRDKKGFDFKHIEKDEAKNRVWRYFNEEELKGLGIEYTVLGELDNEKPNFIRISQGKGNIYLHANPYTFTNFHLLDEHKLEYAGKAFSHLEERNIYWDQKSIRKARLDDIQGANQSALAYILSQKSLRWSWYLLLATVLLYLLFRAKREQRIIPVLAGNVNTSLEFINTIGRLYFLKNDHRKLAKRKMQLFLAYVRDHYKIPTLKIDQEMKERLASKAEVPLTLVEDIFVRFQRLDRASEISSDYLVNFHQTLEQFYKKCK